MKCSPCEIRLFAGGPLPAHNLEILKELVKKAALRKLKQMQCEAQREASWRRFFGRSGLEPTNNTINY
jgi:hypothetical protein